MNLIIRYPRIWKGTSIGTTSCRIWRAASTDRRRSLRRKSSGSGRNQRGICWSSPRRIWRWLAFRLAASGSASRSRRPGFGPRQAGRTSTSPLFHKMDIDSGSGWRRTRFSCEIKDCGSMKFGTVNDLWMHNMRALLYVEGSSAIMVFR